MSVSYRNTGDSTVNQRSGRQNQLDSEVEIVNPRTPLMGDANKNTPVAETGGNDDKEVVNRPKSGIDDGLLDKDVSPERNHMEHNNDNGHTHYDENDGVHLRHHNHQLELDLASVLEEIPDLNVYQHKKTLAQGMMDLALFSANANQLRYVLDSFERHPYYYPSVIFITFSLILQVAIGVLLIWNATYNVKDEKEVCRANKINNYTVIGIFLVTVVNVFISAFGVADPVTSSAQVFPRAANST